MRHKEFVITRIEAQINLLESLAKRLDGNIIQKPEALAVIANTIKSLELVVDRISLEHEE